MSMQIWASIKLNPHLMINHILEGRRDNVPTVDGFTHINVINI